MAAADQTSGLHIHFTDAASYMRTELAQDEVSSAQLYLMHVRCTSRCAPARLADECDQLKQGEAPLKPRQHEGAVACRTDQDSLVSSSWTATTAGVEYQRS